MVYNGLVYYDLTAQVAEVVIGLDGREPSQRRFISLAMKYGMM